MRILIVGAGGTIGRAVSAALAQRHEVVGVSRSTRPIGVDIADPASIRSMYAAVGRVDAVVSTSGQARFKPLAGLEDGDFEFSLRNKLMGQVNLVRLGLEQVADRGVLVVTSGVLGRSPMQGSAVVSLVNAGLEGFMRAAAFEAPRGIRVNAVSPPWVSETLLGYGMDPKQGLPAQVVAQSYVEAVEGTRSGFVFEPGADSSSSS